MGPVTARLIVRRVPERNTTKLAATAQDGLFDVWRYHAVFTNQTTPLVEDEKTHRGHSVIEQVPADLGPAPGRTCHRNRSTPTPSGSPSPPWRSTSPAPSA